jgi:hypothetical protein
LSDKTPLRSVSCQQNGVGGSQHQQATGDQNAWCQGISVDVNMCVHVVRLHASDSHVSQTAFTRYCTADADTVDMCNMDDGVLQARQAWQQQGCERNCSFSKSCSFAMVTLPPRAPRLAGLSIGQPSPSGQTGRCMGIDDHVTNQALCRRGCSSCRTHERLHAASSGTNDGSGVQRGSAGLP